MEKLLEKVSHDFVYGGHLLSLGTASVVWTVLLIMGKSGGWSIIILAYLISQIVYNLDHIIEEVDTSNSSRTKHLRKNISKQRFLMLIYTILLVFVFTYTNWRTMLAAGILIGSGILYTTKLKNMTKNWVGFKSFYVSFFWGMLVFLILSHHAISFIFPYVIFFLFIFLRLLVNTIFFDIKDMVDDKKAGFKTFPVLFGVEETIKYIHLINITSAVLLLVAVVYNAIPTISLSLLIFPFYSQVYLQGAQKISLDRIRTRSYYLVDGEYLLWPATVIFSRLLIQ